MKIISSGYFKFVILNYDLMMNRTAARPPLQSQETYSQETHGIKISVTPEPREESSDPLRSVFAFSYTVTIENFSPETIQLIERRWQVFSSGQCVAEVEGPGVVGVQPTLQPGESFEYTSGAAIHEPIGSMVGSYIFKTTNDRQLEIPIPEFALTYPLMVH